MGKHADGSGARLEGPAPLTLVERQLRETEGYLLEVVTSDFPFATVIAQYLLRAGGKRLRVAMAFLGAGFGDRDPAREHDVRKLAASIELTHQATLQHDDVIDEAETRHAVPAVNVKWSNTLAILSGDYLFAKSSQLAAEVGGEAPLVLAKTIAALCEGQIKEIESAFRADRTLDDRVYVMERKTARLYAASAYLGARVGGADAQTAETLRRFATAFGVSFQFVDDLLDFLGDPAVTGKPVGTDLKLGVYTLPVLHAITERADLAEQLTPDVDFDRFVHAMHETGSFAYTSGVAERYTNDAFAELRKLPDVPERRALWDLVEYAVVRRMPVSSAA